MSKISFCFEDADFAQAKWLYKVSVEDGKETEDRDKNRDNNIFFIFINIKWKEC